MRSYVSLILFIFIQTFISAQAGVIKGTVRVEYSEPAVFATAAVYQNDKLVTGTDTDFDGNFQLNLEPGVYLIKVRYLGYYDYEMEVSLKDNEVFNLTVKLRPNQYTFDCWCSYNFNLIDLSNTTSGSSFISHNGFIKPKI